jgi:nicotinamide riboside kinase
MLVLKIWSKFRFGRVSNFVKQSALLRKYDHHLLCKPDLPWSPDPLRESPSHEEREVLFNLYQNELEGGNCNYSIVEGQGDERLDSAVSALKRLKFF